MKTNILRLIVLVISISCVTMLSAQEKSLRKYTMMEGVECVNLSKELLSLIPASKDSKFEGFVDKIDNVQIIKTQKKKLVKKFKKEWPKVLETEDYNSIMTMNQDGKNLHLFSKANPNGTSTFILIAMEKTELNLIAVTGTLTQEDVNAIQEIMK